MRKLPGCKKVNCAKPVDAFFLQITSFYSPFPAPKFQISLCTVLCCSVMGWHCRLFKRLLFTFTWYHNLYLLDLKSPGQVLISSITAWVVTLNIQLSLIANSTPFSAVSLSIADCRIAQHNVASTSLRIYTSYTEVMWIPQMQIAIIYQNWKMGNSKERKQFSDISSIMNSVI